MPCGRTEGKGMKCDLVVVGAGPAGSMAAKAAATAGLDVVMIEKIEAPLVIGADGVESKVGRWAGIDTALKPKDIEVAAQFLVQDRSIEDDFCHFYLGNRIAPGAYAWIFPKGDKLANVGLGVLGSKSRQGDPLRLLQEFVKSRLPDGKILEMDVGGVPVAPQLDAMTGNGVMLVGDAAHHSDPLTGGGIINGMVAGELAGGIAAKAMSSGDVSRDGLEAYEDQWKDLMGRQLQRHYELKEFFVKLTDDDLNALLHSLIREDTSKMDLRSMLRALLKLNPKLLWSLRGQII